MGQVRVKIAERARAIFVLITILVGFLSSPVLSAAQDADQNSPQSASANQKKTVKTPSDPTIENNIDAVEADESEEATRGFKHWNEFDGKYITARVGAGFLYEIAAFAQNQQSKEQFPLEFAYKVRDFRVLFSGRFPEFKRSVTYSVGVMYDGPSGSWLIHRPIVGS